MKTLCENLKINDLIRPFVDEITMKRKLRKVLGAPIECTGAFSMFIEYQTVVIDEKTFEPIEEPELIVLRIGHTVMVYNK